ncbi:DUF1643 domain-containing protein [Ornithinibacillus halophilus]|uniref:DUF1643 domain-containing protein n=1 Tax=Ornithinibacillus halophilus TaxID=930117 RepID=A0A1M5GMB9_9BACI|nr:DUF1643 domain-containing protein [Ornithinibacillus halophilus]SHG04691.1 hypothetical protein SAMN05216225_101365 [Ornithinibacillus halophilus]
MKSFPSFVEVEKINIDMDLDKNCRYYIRIPLKQDDEQGKKVLVILKNPSKAKIDHQEGIYESDQTVDRILVYFKKSGYSEVTIVNLFATFSTDSECLNQYLDSPEVIIGEKNDEVLKDMIHSNEFERIVVAWGGYPNNANRHMKSLYQDRIMKVEKLLAERNAYYVERMVGGGMFPRHGMTWFTKELKPMKKYKNVFYK